jgi:hypothetical protein
MTVSILAREDEAGGLVTPSIVMTMRRRVDAAMMAR